MPTPGHNTLRWGYSTGACAAAVATAAWNLLTRQRALTEVRLLFLDGRERDVPLLGPRPGAMAAVRKDGGDDPDCTHGATIYANIQPCAPGEALARDYVLPVGEGMLVVRAVEGIGLCTRQGLDCDMGRWAINTGPRRMIVENLLRAGLTQGCWRLDLGVEDGKALAGHTLNAHLGIEGGISILGTTGLVRPYSHEAYTATIRLCVKSHASGGGRTMVFCTGGRTKAGARARRPDLPPSAFACIGDFIADSLALACGYGMDEILVACMAGKLCKYAAGFGNTHAHKVSQDMDLLRAEVRRAMPREGRLHEALAHSHSVREALLSIPEEARPGLLRRLADVALGQLARHCPGTSGAVPGLGLLVFDFAGGFLFEAHRAPSRGEGGQKPCPPAAGEDAPLSDAGAAIGLRYFMREADL